MDELIINKHNNVLLVGKAATDYGVGEIIYSEDSSEIFKKYGDSDLSKAFYIAQNMGVKYIFCMNLQKDADYFDAVESLKQSDFTYVVFVSLLLSDTFQETYNNGLVHSTLAHLLGRIGRDCMSSFIITDKHASLYENIDTYLEDMRTTQNRFLNACSVRTNLQNVIFIANNLKNYSTSTVPLAAALCGPVNEYPVSKQFGEAIFHIDRWDDPGSMSYFRTNVTRETTIENLLNMLRSFEPEKVVFIDRILKYIQREMDFQEFKGRKYTEYQKLLFQQKLERYYEELKGFILNDYVIKNIDAYRDEPGTVTMLARVDVQPINCLEICTIKKEVEF